MTQALLIVSIAAMAGEFVYRVGTRSARLVPRTLALIAGLWVVAAIAPIGVVHMGGIDETASIVICYLTMLLGMTAEYFYAQAERGQKRATFSWLSFLMPIFASPIVFIPLLTLTSELGPGGAFTRARVMVYLVAFQNGFFWKTFFEQRQKQMRSAPARSSVEPAAIC